MANSAVAIVEKECFPYNPMSIIAKHSVAKGMNLSFSCNKSSGLGENSSVSPYIEFTYMACNPWKFSNSTAQGKAESMMRLQQVYKEYESYFTDEQECIYALTHLLYTTLDTFTRRERIQIIDKLIMSGLLAECWGDYIFNVEQSEALAFTVACVGKEQYLLSHEEQKQCIHKVYKGLAEDSVADIVEACLCLGKQQEISYEEFAKQIEEVYEGLSSTHKEALPFGSISKNVVALSSALVSLIDLLEGRDSTLVERMYYVLANIRLPILENAGLENEIAVPLTSVLALPWEIIELLGSHGMLATQYAFGTTVLRLVLLCADLEKSIAEEKSVLWILSSLELFIDSAQIEYDEAIEGFLYSTIKTLDFTYVERAWKCLQEESSKKFIASFAFAYHHTSNAMCQRIYFFLSYFVQAISFIMSDEMEEQFSYDEIWGIDETCLSILAQYGIPVEEVYLLHRLREVVEILTNDVEFSCVEEQFFSAITAFGEQYHKALTQVGIKRHDKRQQINWCRSLFHRVVHMYGDLPKKQILAKLKSVEFVGFQEKHTFLQSSKEGSTWFGSWILLQIVEEYASGIRLVDEVQGAVKESTGTSIFQRRARRKSSEGIDTPIATYFKNDSFTTFAEKCVESPEGIHTIRKKLTQMNVSQDVLVGTYLQVAVQNNLITEDESIEIYTNLHGIEGVEIPLFKVNLSNTLQLKGHLHEIRMASTASMFGFDVYSMNKLYRVQNEERTQYEVDILMKKYGITIGIEVKDLLDTRGTNFKDIADAVQKMGAFKKYQGGEHTLAVLTQSGRPPSNEKMLYLNDTAKQAGVHLLYGGIREQLLAIDKIAKSEV